MAQVVTFFLALISQQREVCVLKSTGPHFRRLYRSHMLGEHVETAKMFRDGRPRLFLLEKVEISAEKAMGRCIVWSRRFRESGYDVVNWAWAEPYVLHPHPDDKATYEDVCRYDLEALCAPKADIAVDFVFKETAHTVKLSVTYEELRELKVAAADLGISLDAYCKKRFFGGRVESLNFSELRSCEIQCRQVTMLLERERRMALLREDGQTMGCLQTAVDALRQEVRDLTAAIRGYMEGGI